MRKLEKLTLKEMKTEMDVFSNRELRETIGGSDLTWSYEDYVAFIKNEFEDTFEPIINAVDDALDSATDFFEDRAEAFSNLTWSAVEDAVTGWLDNVGGGGTPIGAPIIFIDNPNLLPGSDLPGSDIGFEA